MSYDLSDYVDVAERIRIFKDKYPEGVLQSEVTFMADSAGQTVGVLCKAFAFRIDQDPTPGIGHAYEPIPGKTPYTKDSEVMNAETSAWGRAIVALGFETKKIASAEEVRNRSAGGPSTASVSERQDRVAGDGTAAASAPPAEAGSFVFPFGKYKDKTVAEADANYLEWVLTKFTAKTPADHALIEAVGEFLVPGSEITFPDDDIPF